MSDLPKQKRLLVLKTDELIRRLTTIRNGCLSGKSETFGEGECENEYNLWQAALATAQSLDGAAATAQALAQSAHSIADLLETDYFNCLSP